MSSAGKRFLADLADPLPDAPPLSAAAAATPPSAGPGGRPILGGGKIDLPDTAAHSWNVNVPDFVPLAPAQTTVAPSQSRQSQPPLPPQPPPWQQPGSDAIGQLISQSLAILAGACGEEDRDRADAELNACLMRLHQLPLSKDDPSKLVLVTLNFAKLNPSLCQPAANLLAFLACYFVVSQQVSPHLISNRPNSRLSFNPIYEALLTVCSAENERIRLEIANLKAVSSEQANYILLFAWVYFYLPSLQSPSQRQGALALNTAMFLKQLADLPACPLAFRTCHAALIAVGGPLDIDMCDPDCDKSGDLFRLVGEVYDQLRTAAASGRIGDPAVSVDIIRLLELRAADWMYRTDAPGGGGGGGAYSASTQESGLAAGFAGLGLGQQQYSASGDVQSMTDDMYADYEQFLRESGQL